MITENVRNDLIDSAKKWREGWGKVGVGGVVVLFNGEAQGWMNELRDPHHWVPGCFAVNESGQVFQTIAGDEPSGALMWLCLENPD